jgi:hypothetical protein
MISESVTFSSLKLIGLRFVSKDTENEAGKPWETPLELPNLRLVSRDFEMWMLYTGSRSTFINR